MKNFMRPFACLDQLDAKDAGSKKKIADIITEVSAKLGEKIELRRFQRFEVGEGIEKADVDYAAEVAQAAAGV